MLRFERIQNGWLVFGGDRCSSMRWQSCSGAYGDVIGEVGGGVSTDLG